MGEAYWEARRGDLLRAFQKLNPQVGDPCSTSDGSPASARRPLLPPTEAAPPPVNFTVEEVLRRVRSSNKNSAGGLSGSDYQSLSSWLHCDDELTGKLVKLMNRIAAGDVPHCIVGLLTAGRGVVIPKDEVGGLRPIVVGHILLRFVGSLALSKEASPIRDFFKPVQFGVGVQGVVSSWLPLSAPFWPSTRGPLILVAMPRMLLTRGIEPSCGGPCAGISHPSSPSVVFYMVPRPPFSSLRRALRVPPRFSTVLVRDKAAPGVRSATA